MRDSGEKRTGGQCDYKVIEYRILLQVMITMRYSNTYITFEVLLERLFVKKHDTYKTSRTHSSFMHGWNSVISSLFYRLQ